MYTSFVKYLLNPSSLRCSDLLCYSILWRGLGRSEASYISLKWEKWVVMLRRVQCMPVLTDGWKTVVSELKLQKDCLLTFLPINHFGLHLSCYVNGVCDQSYFTINRNLRLGFTIIEDSFVQQCFEDNLLAASYEINYKGSPWIVSTSKFNSKYVFSQGWTRLCNDLGVQEDDLLVFEKLTDVMFGLTVYRDVVEVRLSKKVESDDDDDVLLISKADYDEALFKDIQEDESPSGAVPSRTPKNVHVQDTMQYVEGKGKAKIFADGSDTVENFNKECKGRKRSTKSDSILCHPSVETVKKLSAAVQNVKHRKKVTRNVRKVSGVGMDPEFFNFSRKGEHRLRLPVEVVNRAGLSQILQPISVQNMNGDVEVYETKTELNGGTLRYAVDGWRKFMEDNQLQFGHMLHFTYVTSQRKIVLNDVTSI
ncbi:putative transcription factor B3-Domain family [Helianthus annuus]|nr:putative transcription factor B3-Domain family [Helianthus annuus]